jgi:hypothetical protein
MGNRAPQGASRLFDGWHIVSMVIVMHIKLQEMDDLKCI